MLLLKKKQKWEQFKNAESSLKMVLYIAISYRFGSKCADCCNEFECMSANKNHIKA